MHMVDWLFFQNFNKFARPVRAHQTSNGIQLHGFKTRIHMDRFLADRALAAATARLAFQSLDSKRIQIMLFIFESVNLKKA